MFLNLLFPSFQSLLTAGEKKSWICDESWLSHKIQDLWTWKKIQPWVLVLWKPQREAPHGRELPVLTSGKKLSSYGGMRTACTLETPSSNLQLQDHWLHGLRQGFFQWVALLRGLLNGLARTSLLALFCLNPLSPPSFSDVSPVLRSEVSICSLLFLPSLSFPVVFNKSLVYI